MMKKKKEGVIVFQKLSPFRHQRHFINQLYERKREKKKNIDAVALKKEEIHECTRVG